MKNVAIIIAGLTYLVLAFANEHSAVAGAAMFFMSLAPGAIAKASEQDGSIAMQGVSKVALTVYWLAVVLATLAAASLGAWKMGVFYLVCQIAGAGLIARHNEKMTGSDPAAT